jgi:hypothetical protein
MSTKMATWLPGNAVQPEFQPLSQRKMAGSAVFGGADITNNWFHFPMTTPVIIDDRRPLLDRVFVLYKMTFCAVMKVHLWSGSTRIGAFNVVQEPGDVRRMSPVTRNNFEARKTQFSFTEDAFIDRQPVLQGLSISVNVAFDSRNIDVIRNLGQIEFFSAGADWFMP